MQQTFPPQVEQFVRQELATGRYENEQDLLIRALKVYQELKTRHEALRADVQRSIDQAERGEVASLDMGVIKDRLRSDLDENGQLR